MPSRLSEHVVLPGVRTCSPCCSEALAGLAGSPAFDEGRIMLSPPSGPQPVVSGGGFTAPGTTLMPVPVAAVMRMDCL